MAAKTRKSGKSSPAAAPPALAPNTPTRADALPWTIWIIAIAHMVCLAAIVLAMTPLTYNLDDIKQLIFFVTSPILMLVALGAIALRHAPGLPRSMAWPLGVYCLVLVVSSLLSEFGWIAWHVTLFVWVWLGFFTSALCIGAHRRSSEWFIRFAVLMLLTLNVVGYMMFDVFGSGSVVGWFFDIYSRGGPPRADQATARFIYSLALTLDNADGVLQSTILNRDFFAAFCLLYLPFAMMTALDPGPIAGSGRIHTFKRETWRTLGVATTLLSLLSIFFCQSKGEWIFGTICFVFFIAAFLKVGHAPHVRRRHMLSFIGGLGLLMIVLAWLRSPTLLGQLKSLAWSIESRAIIWGGSIGIFKEFPIFGGGPGTFRVYFPRWRRPDYFNHEISNVTLFSHNYFLDLLCETGVLGLMAFTIFLGALAVLGLRWMLKHPDARMRLMLLAALTGLLGMFGSNLSSPNARWVIGSSSLWTILGFTSGLLRQADGWKPQTRTHTGQHAWRWMALAVPALIGVVALPFAIRSGVHYFKGAREYAEGLRNMEPVYNRINDKDINMRWAVGSLEAATQRYAKSLKYDPTKLSTHYKLASSWMTLYQLQERSIHDYRDRLTPTQLEAARRTADRYLDHAMERYETLREIAPDYAEIHYNMGIVCHEKAKRLRWKAQTDPEDAAELNRQADEYDQRTRDHLDKMTAMSIKREVAVLHAQQLVAMGRDDEARDVYRDALAIHPDDKGLARNYYTLAQRTGDTRQTAEALERLWRQDPTQDAFLNRVLAMADEYGFPDLTERALDHLATLNPVDPRLDDRSTTQTSR